MRVVNVKTRTVGGDHVGHTQRVRIHHGDGVIALEIKTAAITQRVLLAEVPARARTGIECCISHHRVRGGDNR